MQSWWKAIENYLTIGTMWNLILAILIFAIGLMIARRASTAASRLTPLDTQQRLLFTKLTYYGLLVLAVTAALSQLGVDLKVLLGAAGILTVAVGFAAQTSASNLISGIFLMIERPFIAGDAITVGDIRGEVISIDLLSTKIRTVNNVMVRIPNETMMKSNINNYSFFPIRRLDLNLGVGYDSDLAQVEKICRTITENHPLCLDDPAPIFLITAFADSSVSVQFQVWTQVPNLVAVQNDLYRSIKRDFDQAGILIPFPTRTVITTAPFSPSSPAIHGGN